MKKELELYIHIPFCIKKCAYCDFLSGPADQDTIELYVDSLCREIASKKMCAEKYVITTIFVGGGTPSILSGEQLNRVMKAVRTTFDVNEHAEISMEANPGTVTEEKLIAYKKAGINRISFGLQSTNNEELKMLGRIHTYEEFLESYRMARACGFQNMNVDLISAIPGQTVESWEESVRKVLALEPEHISAYSLIIEEGTPFAKQFGEGGSCERMLPTEDAERIMYRRTEELLRDAGYHRYEISNYCKDGKECRHNLGYWERKEYLGLGLGASSLLNNQRFHNTNQLTHYMEESKKECPNIREELESLSKTDQMEEFIFLGMRKMKGISVDEFCDTFGCTLEECYGKGIHRMKKEGLVMEEGVYLRLTQQGIDVSNYVFAEILI